MTNQIPNPKKAYVLDTSVVEHDPNAILNFEEHDIIILTTVLEEIDHLKKGDDSRAYIAREIHRKLDEFGQALIPKPSKNQPEKKVSALFHGGVPLGEGLGKIEVKIAPRKIHQSVQALYSDDNQDNRILSAVFQMQVDDKEKRRIILVSKDINLRLKAKSLGIEVEDYENDKIPSIDQLYLGREEILHEGLSTVIDQLYKTKKVPIFDQPYSEIFKEESILPNKFFVLKSGASKSVLARVDRNMEYFHLAEKRTISGITPRNAEQIFSVAALLEDDVKLVTLLGKAGTGKTLLAMATGIYLMTSPRDKPYEKIIIASAMMTLSNKDMGALPGGPTEKVLPYMQGLYDNISFIKSQNKGKFTLPKEMVPEKPAKKKQGKQDTPEEKYDYITKLQMLGKIEVQPIAFIRGRSLNNVFLIIDEAQNLTPHEVKTIITRAGENCKIIFCGDIEQIDAPYLDARSSGLSYIVYTMSGKKLVAHITLEKGERSELAELAADLM